jgi:transposase-like protein
MMRSEFRERRESVAAAVRNGTPVAEAARKHGLSLTTVYHACSEFGVKAAPRERTPSTLEIVAELLRGGRPADIAEAYGVTRQRVHGVKMAARKAGIRV